MPCRYICKLYRFSFHLRTPKRGVKLKLPLPTVVKVLKNPLRRSSIPNRGRIIIQLIIGASLMNNLSSLFATPPPGSGTKSNIPQAKAWASKALEVVEKARTEGGSGTNSGSEDVIGCDQVLSTVLFNMGMLCEVSGRVYHLFLGPFYSRTAQLLIDGPPSVCLVDFSDTEDGRRQGGGTTILPANFEAFQGHPISPGCSRSQSGFEAPNRVIETEDDLRCRVGNMESTVRAAQRHVP